MRYFAYGSNMNRAQMAFRCPGAVALGPARLDGWRLFFTREGYAAIAPNPSAVVWGALWRLSMQDVATLDLYEGVAHDWYRKARLAVRPDGHAHAVSALTYVAGPRVSEAHRPRRHYFEQLVLGPAEEWGLPARHLAVIRACARDGFKR